MSELPYKIEFNALVKRQNWRRMFEEQSANVNYLQGALDQQAARIAELEAENAKLRAALESIANAGMTGGAS